MNLHIGQSLEARSELHRLSHVKSHMISAQACCPNLKIVQDSLIGMYMMTLNFTPIPKDEFHQICMSGDGWTPNSVLDNLERIEKVYSECEVKESVYNGRALFSLVLPPDLIYTCHNKANEKEPVVRIYKGVLLEGTINKKVLGNSHTSLIQILYKEYGVDVAATFVDNVQFIATAWLMYNSFSVGIEDCIATKQDEIEDIITKCFIEAKGIQETTQLAGICEARLVVALSNARDIGMKIAKDAMSKNNNFVATVTSGSKGDWFNITQIAASLGQQNMTGKRIQPALNQGRRTLIHYDFDKLNLKEEFESRGFVSSSFIQGLNPMEFFFHAMTGREGVSDTAMKTSRSGYLQRRMVKCLEDLSVQYDGTVRNKAGSVIQLAYSENGLSGSEVIIKGGKPMMGDVKRLVDRLNLNCESS